MTSHASEAWDELNAELACVDDEYLKRAFVIVWRARGAADRALIKDDNLCKLIGGLEQPFWD